MKLASVFAGLSVMVAAGGTASANEWVVDDSHSSVTFTITHLMITDVKGEFGTVAGTVKYDPKNPTAAQFNITADVTAIDTNNEKRDQHLRSPDFFDTKKFPKATFVSTRVRKADGNKIRVLGNLTIRGVTKPVEVVTEIKGPVTDPWGTVKVAASTTVEINRKDYGINWNKNLDAGGVVVGDVAKLTIDLELNKKNPKKS